MKNEDPKQFGPLKFLFNRFFDQKQFVQMKILISKHILVKKKDLESKKL